MIKDLTKELTLETLPKELTLETLPKAFKLLSNEVSEIKRLIVENVKVQPIETDCWFNLNELCYYHPDKPSKPTVYGWVQEEKVPYHKGFGQKKLRFLKSEIDSWLKLGRHKTFAETAAEADTFLRNNKNGLNHGK